MTEPLKSCCSLCHERGAKVAKTQLADIKERAQPLLETMARIVVIDPVYDSRGQTRNYAFVDAGTLAKMSRVKQ